MPEGTHTLGGLDLHANSVRTVFQPWPRFIVAENNRTSNVVFIASTPGSNSSPSGPLWSNSPAGIHPAWTVLVQRWCVPEQGEEIDDNEAEAREGNLSRHVSDKDIGIN
jgi:hypothetical protein